MTDPNEDFCRKLPKKFAFEPYPGHVDGCPCVKCENYWWSVALVSKAIHIVMEKAVEVIEDVYGPEAKVNDPREFIIERLRSLQLSAEDVRTEEK